MPETIDWPPHRRSRRRGLILLLVVAGVLLLGGGTALSYYVDALWFDSLGYGAVFWKTLNLQATVFSTFTLATFVILYGSFVALKPPRLGELTGFPILINGQPIKLPVEPVLRLIAIVASLLIAFATGAGMMAQWSTLALWWYARGDALPGAAAGVVDPIFGRPLPFYLFTLPAWQLLSGWVMPLALAARTYLGRFAQLFEDHTIFSGVTYTEAHITLTGALVVSAALALGAAIAFVNAASSPKLRWLVAAIAPAALCYVVVGVLGWYVTSFIVKPNELVRE